MKRSWRTWTGFGVCLAVVLAALAWVSLTTMRLERAQEEARQQALLEENVRLALWRMDSALGPLVAQETARPYFDYSAFYAAERAYGHMFNPIDTGEVLVPSPLLGEPPPYILLHFQFGPDGALTSPQAPTGNMRDLAEMLYRPPEALEAATRHLAQLKALVTRDTLLSLLPTEEARSPLRVAFRRKGLYQAPNGEQAQQARNAAEWRARAQANFDNQMRVSQRAIFTNRPSSSDVTVGALTPLWVGGELLLVRQVSVNGSQYVQGSWLDWPVIRSWLLAGVQDLLPGAALRPVSPPSEDALGRRLAAVPFLLVPGPGPEKGASATSAFPGWLLILWGVVLVAAAGASALVGGIVSLSERRAAFVSAVTHELRTPLTTVRMYAEMLAEGMVPQEEARQQYLRTLLAEADRLTHLVENVLAYAQLERGRPEARAEPVSVGDLLDQVEDRLRNRAEHTGMKLVVETENDTLSLAVRVDPSAVEQILFNLVDNACKYAASACDRLIHLNVGRSSQTVLLRVRDHGPGVSREEVRRLFRPFSKSAGDAANTAPGVGLGLALSRGLARRMGGDLSLEREVDDGACFVLRLPAS